MEFGACLYYDVPKTIEGTRFLSGYLENLVSTYSYKEITVQRDKKEIRVVTSDLSIFKMIINTLSNLGPTKITNAAADILLFEDEKPLNRKRVG